MTTPVLDAGALIGIERRKPRMLALLDEIMREEIPTYVPAGVVAQVWRGSPCCHDIARLLNTKTVRVEPLDDRTARQVGLVLDDAGARDVVDGHVALLTRRVRGTVYTSDPGDLATIDHTLDIVTV
jgi:hypothetical protein